MLVVKKDGRKELFDREKLSKSLMTALRKRPVTQMQISQMVSDIEQQLTENGRSEVTSKEVGDSVLGALKAVDFIGYMRYASVYHDFRGPEDVMKLVGTK